MVVRGSHCRRSTPAHDAQLRFDIVLCCLARGVPSRRATWSRDASRSRCDATSSRARARARSASASAAQHAASARLFFRFLLGGEADHQLLLLHIKALLDSDAALLHHIALLLHRRLGGARRREAVYELLG